LMLLSLSQMNPKYARHFGLARTSASFQGPAAK
jgi:hypothetical protein